VVAALPDSAKRDRAIQHAMDTIEEDYDGLKGVLPKGEYSELDNEALGQLLRTLNPEEFKQASGDIFDRIYEYFLTQFADLKAHDGGEFFTPVSLVQMIANVIEPLAIQNHKTRAARDLLLPRLISGEIAV
jgi:type I restriction enzyme M protein